MVDIPYYQDYIPQKLRDRLLEHALPVKEVPGLVEIGKRGGLEFPEALQLLCNVYEEIKSDLNRVLNQRQLDRKFIDERTKSFYEYNNSKNIRLADESYKTVIGLKDSEGRTVFGPLNEKYFESNGKKIQNIPEHLKGPHITLFGPPDTAKMSINAMNAFHRKLSDEPAIIESLLNESSVCPKWGADDEDSKTPLRRDLIVAGENLRDCFNRTIKFKEGEKLYQLKNSKLSLPIKRFPGLALPCMFLFFNGNPIPLHIYDFFLHLYEHRNNINALTFYVPKLENEEEALYLQKMISISEDKIKEIDPSYIKGSIRLLIVLENPRAVFRLNEIIDNLFPYFAGASLGWHDYLASTARIMKEDANYRIPVKADPDIVIKHIKGSHELLSNVVGPRGGIKIGGMYGILPIGRDIKSESFQQTLKGYFKDVITQMKRGLDGFWVAHPDFVRIGIALVEAWNRKDNGESIKEVIKSYLNKEHFQEVVEFLNGPDISGLNKSDPLYGRSLIVADIEESDFISNSDPEEIRYNVFQCLQYLADWLCGNGCVALPALIEGVAVRVMDDLATTERSRWEVWHEINPNRFSIDEFLKIAHEEMLFIRKNLSNEKKIVQIKWDQRTEKWYPVAFNLMIKLMTDPNPVEFATELLMPFTIDLVRDSVDPWAEIIKIDSNKYSLDRYTEKFNYYFETCGEIQFAKSMASNISLDKDQAFKIIKGFSINQVINAASFHGDIGQKKKGLDRFATHEQNEVFKSENKIREDLLEFGEKYKSKFGFKFLVSAQGKNGEELLEILKERFLNSKEEELQNAKNELYKIAEKRFDQDQKFNFNKKLDDLAVKFKIPSAQICVFMNHTHVQTYVFGSAKEDTRFQIASLSKTFATHYCLEFFTKKGISIDTSVNSILKKIESDFRLESDITLRDLMGHTALNMHYVNGFIGPLPKIEDLVRSPEKFGYENFRIINNPGKQFKYSGGGFIILQYIIEKWTQKPIKDLGICNFLWSPEKDLTCEMGFRDNGDKIESGYLTFPGFAAGAHGTAKDVLDEVSKIAISYSDVDSPFHDTAVKMLFARDLGSRDFMGVESGLGVFVAECGPNRFMLHQGANDGFRAIYLYCFSGPDTGKGISILSTSEVNAVQFISLSIIEILKELKVQGLKNLEIGNTQSSFTDHLQEEIVNQGYKELIFSKFKPDLPEVSQPSDKRFKYWEQDLLNEATLLGVSNQKFARAINLISPFEPVFDPKAFGKQGKIMDSWESARHNPKEYDWVHFQLKETALPKYARVSTRFHDGNHAESLIIEGRKGEETWERISTKVKLEGNSEKYFELKNGIQEIDQIRVLIFPDGGLTRLSLFEKDFNFSKVRANTFESIPKTIRPLHIPFTFKNEGKNPIFSLKPGELFNNASMEYGAKVLSSSNEHYGPASQVLSPYLPINMFDGLESARSRDPNHLEFVEIQLAKRAPIEFIELDFTYFINNNPKYISVEAKDNEQWNEIVKKSFSKPYFGNKMRVYISSKSKFEILKFKLFPDGGVNRIRVISRFQ